MKAIMILLSFLLFLMSCWVIYLDTSDIHKPPGVIIALTSLSIAVSSVILLVSFVVEIKKDL